MKTYINPYKKFNGVFIPDWLLESELCSVNAKVMYALLAKYAGENGYCYPKQETLAKKIGTSRRSVINYLKELQDCKLIERKRTKGNNNYFFLQHELMNQCEKPAHTKVQDSAHTDVKDSAHTYKENHIKENHIKTHTTRVNGVDVLEGLEEKEIEWLKKYIKYLQESHRIWQTSMQTELVMAKLVKFKNEGHEPIEIIKTVIEGNHKKLYKPDNFRKETATYDDLPFP